MLSTVLRTDINLPTSLTGFNVRFSGITSGFQEITSGFNSGFQEITPKEEASSSQRQVITRGLEGPPPPS